MQFHYAQTTDLSDFTVTIGVVIAAVVAIIVVRVVLSGRRDDSRVEWRWRTQALTFGIAALGVVAVLLTLPSGDLDKQTVLSVIGLGLTAIIALSASTIVANAMSGLMLHSVGNFRPGDFVRVGDHFGRVTERGLFHTELQTEDGDLTTLPNSLLVNHAVTVIRKTGTVVSATVSLGYDVPRTEIEAALIAAASSLGLEEPFVHITELGDFSVTYRIAGFLTDVKHVLRNRSRLRASVLDHLHRAGIEIVSPTFMNQRAVPPEQVFIPRRQPGTGILESHADEVPADLVFDKAERAGHLEELRDRRTELHAELERLDAASRTGEIDPDRAIRRRAAIERMLGRVEAAIESTDAEHRPH